MKLSKVIIPVVGVVLGIAIGYIIFSDNSNTPKQTNTEKQIWTCSMHPQIEKDEPGQCPICGMDLIPKDNLGGDDRVFELSEEANKLAQVQTIVVGDSTENENNLVLSGKIQADETNAASIVSHIPGRIEKLYVKFTGEKIRRGQKIASIYSPNLITAQKELLEAHKMKDVNPQLYEASLNKLRYWKIKESQIDRIIETNKVQESFDIFADHSGVVLKKNVNVGDHLMEGEVLFSVQNLNQLWGVFEIYENDIQSIQEGDRITFTTPAYPNNSFETEVEFIDPVIDPKTRTAEVRVAIKNRDQKFKPEMFIEGQLQTSEQSSKNVLMIPASAVLWTGEMSVVFVKLPNSEKSLYTHRKVSIGDKTGGKYPVYSGLKSGEEIVVNGNFMLDASAQLSNKKSMMNSD